MTQGAENFGFNVDSENNVTYREWAPNATEAHLIGDFSKHKPCMFAKRYTYDIYRRLGPALACDEEERIRGL